MYGVRLTREELRDAEVQGWNAAKSWLENERRVEAQHVGKPGARLRGLELRVDHVASWEGRYGITRLYVLRDRAGNCLIWKTGGGTVNLPDAQMSKKEPRQRRLSRWFLADATVKSHGERDGMRQTELTRLKTTAALGELETISEIRGLRT
jgi:hypothetical protein